MNDHLAAGEATRGLVPSGVHTARRQAGKWVGALTNPPQMREHPEGTPASPPPPANTQSRTQPEAQASRGVGGRGEQLKKGTLSTKTMPSASATQDPGNACRRAPLHHSLRQHSPHEHPHANNAETCRHYERGGDEVPCCMNPASCHNSAEFVFQISLLTKLPLCIEER